MKRLTNQIGAILIMGGIIVLFGCNENSGTPNLNDAFQSDFVQKTAMSSNVVHNGDEIEIQYKIALPTKNGQSSVVQQRSMSLTVGNSEVWPELDRALVGMRLKEEKKLEMDGTNIFGKHTPHLLVTLPKRFIPNDIQPKTGEILNFTDATGQTNPRRIVSVSRDSVTVDMNHPLAGRHFTVDLTVEQINQSS